MCNTVYQARQFATDKPADQTDQKEQQTQSQKVTKFYSRPICEWNDDVSSSGMADTLQTASADLHVRFEVYLGLLQFVNPNHIFYLTNVSYI